VITSSLTVKGLAEGIGVSAGGVAFGAMKADVSLGRGNDHDEVEAGVGSGTTVEASALRVTATSNDDLFADSVAGGGGGVAVIGAQASIDDSTSARVYLGSGMNAVAGILDLRSTHTYDVDSSADAYSVGLGTGTGAFASNTITGGAVVDIGAAVIVRADDIYMTALNRLTKQKLDPEESNLRAGTASGALGLSFLESGTDIGTAGNPLETTVNVGSGAILTIDGNNANSGIIQIQAFNDILATDSVRVEGVSGLAGISKAKSRIDAETVVGINLDGATLENAAGGIYLMTRSEVYLYPSANLFIASGFASIGVADAHSAMNVTNRIDITDATLIAEDVYVYAGRGSRSVPNLLKTIANAEITTISLAGISGAPNLEAIVNETNQITIGGTSRIQAFENVNLVTEKGPGDNRAETDGMVLNISLFPYGMNIPDGSSDTSVNTVTIGPAASIEAGVNNMSLVHVKALTLNGEDVLSLDEVNSVRDRLAGDPLLTAAEKAALGLDESLQFEYAALDPDEIALSVYPGVTAVHVVPGVHNGGIEGHHYVFRSQGTNTSERIVLEDEDYSDGSRWLDLEVLFGGTVPPDELAKFNVYDSDETVNFKTTLQDRLYVIKPVNLALPEISYTNVSNLLFEQRQKLLDWISSHGTDSEAIARYEVQLAAIEQTLIDLGLAQYEDDPETPEVESVLVVTKELDLLFIEMPDVYASPGSIFIEADPGSQALIQGAIDGGSLTARANAAIDIVNQTPFTMNVNDTIVEDTRKITVVGDELVVLAPGNVFFNNVSLTAVDSGIQGVSRAADAQVTRTPLVWPVRRSWHSTCSPN